MEDAINSSDEALNESNDALIHTINFRHKEGGYGWLVVICTIICGGITGSISSNYSLVQDKLLVEFNSTDNCAIITGWITSTFFSMEYLFALPASILIGLFGPRKLGFLGAIFVVLGAFLSSLVKEIKVYVITIGIFSSIGNAVANGALYAILPHYFDKKLGLVTGIMYCGTSLITIFSPFYAAYLLKQYGLSYYFQICSLIYLVLIPCTAFYKPMLPSEQYETTREQIRESFQIKILKNPKFLVWIISTAIWDYGSIMFYSTINTFSRTHFPDSSDEILNSLYSASVSIFSVIFGKMVDNATFSPIYFQTICAFLYTSVIALVPSISSFKMLCILMSIVGIADGIFYGVYLSVAKDTCGGSSKNVNQAMGYYSAFMVLPLTIGPLVAGAIYQKYNSYVYAYYQSSVACLVCACIQLFYPGGEIMTYLTERANRRPLYSRLSN